VTVTTAAVARIIPANSGKVVGRVECKLVPLRATIRRKQVVWVQRKEVA